MRLRTIASWVFITLTFGTAQIASANVILADSEADWAAAITDGIDVNGNSVVAGSPLDAAQQGHAATSNGIWNYKATNGGGSTTFSGTQGFLTQWNNGAYSTTHTRIGATRMSPTSTQSGDTYSVREWVGDGLAGQQLLISGSFQTAINGQAPGPLNNGVEVLVVLGEFVIGSALLLPNGDSYDFNILVNNISADPRVRFAVGPGGPIPSGSSVSDFFNDNVNMSATIERVTVDEPLTLLFLMSVLGVVTARSFAAKRGSQ